MKRTTPIEPFGDALASALREFGLERGVREREIFLRWEEIVGTAVARRTKPQRFVDGRLTLHTSDAVWRQELILHREELRKKINAALPEPIVEEIIVR
ncbi:MAG: DUF721 domain-containing protein [Bacteroidota bacterium]|nr:DUF721 domain-containing protein [Bacteroidota bacterium]